MRPDSISNSSTKHVSAACCGKHVGLNKLLRMLTVTMAADASCAKVCSDLCQSKCLMPSNSIESLRAVPAARHC